MQNINKIFFLMFFFNITTVFAQPPFTPSDISGLIMWLKGDGGMILNGNQVQQWSDESSENHNAIQPTPAIQPEFISSITILNNKPIVRFYGNGEIMLVNDTFEVSEIFVLANWSGIGNIFPDWKGIISEKTITSNGDDIILLGQAGDSVLYKWGFFLDSIFVNSIYTKNFSPLNEYKIVFGKSSVIKQFIGLAIGSDRQVGGRFWDGDIAEIIIYDTILNDSLRNLVDQYIQNKYAPPVNLGPDVLVCDTTYNLSTSGYFKNYTWSTGDTTDFITVTDSGKYWLEATNIFGKTSSDTIYIDGFITPINIAPPPSNFLCIDDTPLVWNTGLSPVSYSFSWQDGSTDSLYKVIQTGLYSVTGTHLNGCTKTSDTLIIVDDFSAITFLGQDTTFCSGNSISLQQGASQTVSYLWSDSTTGSTLTITSPGDYWVTVFDSLGCSKTDTINVDIQGTAPVAAFSGTEVCKGFNTVFTDSSLSQDSANIISWLWDFGDSSISTFQNPTHLYDSAGTYSVTLTVITDSGCSSNTAKTVDVNVLPQANFSPLSGCSGAGVPFSDLSSVPAGSITGWQWDFGDGDTSTLQNPAHVFADSGSYNVKLSVFTNNGCVDSITQIVTIKKSPVAGFSHSTGCDGEFLTFTDTSTTAFPWSITSWSWDFGDSGTSVLTNPVHLYADTGMYNVSLIVQALDGCVDTIVVPVIVNPAPVANFIGGDLCINTPYQFIDSSYITAGIIASWYWDFDGLGTSTAQNPLFAFTDTGSRPVNLTVASSDGCTNSFTDTVEVRNTPVVDFIFSPSFGTPPLTVSFTSQSAGADFYNWDFGDGNTSTAQNSTNIYADSGIYTIQLNASDSFGCNDFAIKTIKVLRTILDIAVADVTTNLQSNYLTISADLSNLGTRDITGFELHAQINGGTAIREDWAGLLPPGQKTTYDFNAGFVLPGNFELRYVCVSALNPNNDNDNAPSNNEQCVIFSEGFLALEPYPNPTDNDINIEYIIPYSEFVEVVLYDEIGKRVSTLFSDKAGKGLNKILLDASILNSGMYFYRISFIDQTVVKKFVVSQ